MTFHKVISSLRRGRLSSAVWMTALLFIGISAPAFGSMGSADSEDGLSIDIPAIPGSWKEDMPSGSQLYSEGDLHMGLPLVAPPSRVSNDAWSGQVFFHDIGDFAPLSATSLVEAQAVGYRTAISNGRFELAYSRLEFDLTHVAAARTEYNSDANLYEFRFNIGARPFSMGGNKLDLFAGSNLFSNGSGDLGSGYVRGVLHSGPVNLSLGTSLYYGDNTEDVGFDAGLELALSSDLSLFGSYSSVDFVKQITDGPLLLSEIPALKGLVCLNCKPEAYTVGAVAGFLNNALRLNVAAHDINDLNSLAGSVQFRILK